MIATILCPLAPRPAKRAAAALRSLLVSLGVASPTATEGCAESREYLLEGLAGDLPEPAVSYQSLFKVCLAASTLANAKDAYILRDGGIAITPKNNSITATAEILAQFCESFPTGSARFITPRERQQRAHRESRRHAVVDRFRVVPEDTAGGLTVTMPSEKDLQNNEVGPLIRKFLRGATVLRSPTACASCG